MNQCSHVDRKQRRCLRPDHLDALHVYKQSAPRSKKRAGEEREYRRLRKAFLAEHERCQWPAGCVFRASEVHHRRGRIGALLCAVEHWSALCHDHHAWATEHPAAAVELGLSELRVGASSGFPNQEGDER